MTIAALTHKDISEVVNLHQVCLPTTNSSRFGPQYLRSLYETLLSQKNLHVLLVAREQTKIIGVITLSRDLARTQKLITQAAFPHEILTVLKGIVWRKVSISKIFEQMKMEQSLRVQFPSPYVGILTLFVDGSFRRKGIAQQLLASSESLLGKEKIMNLYVDTEYTNTAARAFYTSRGFIQRKIIMNAVIFSKKLNK